MASKSVAGSKAADMIRISVSEAAKLFGLSPQTIRRAIKDQEIRYVVVRGRYRIAFESVLEWSQRQTTTRHKLERHGIGQYVDRWHIRNKLYSPNPHMLTRRDTNSRDADT
ncbi:helix-turn-helix domain-containing protein [Candidatus Uhrbacteria bacterium]|nr:helix-turn-helix domain-containing protein [Candidatus Uhrbacteria bacterium]